MPWNRWQTLFGRYLFLRETEEKRKCGTETEYIPLKDEDKNSMLFMALGKEGCRQVMLLPNGTSSTEHIHGLPEGRTESLSEEGQRPDDGALVELRLEERGRYSGEETHSRMLQHVCHRKGLPRAPGREAGFGPRTQNPDSGGEITHWSQATEGCILM